MKVKVVTDSGSGLTKDQAGQLDLEYLPLQVIVNETSYLDGVDLTVDELYDKIEKGYLPQTSMPPLGMIEDLFDRFKQEEITDVILVTLSNGLSGTNQAIQASAKWHGIKIHTLDICSTCEVEKYLAVSAAKLNQEGYEPDEIIARLQASVDDSQGYLIVEDLDHLARGGRLTPMAAKLGGLLKIKPILKISKDTEGKVDVCDKVRTASKAIKKACQFALKDLKSNYEDYEVFVIDSNSSENAELMMQELKDEIPNLTCKRDNICAVISSHTGTKAVAIQYIKKVKGVN